MSRSRGPTKAEQIVAESKNRTENARLEAAKARVTWETSHAVYQAMYESHAELERLLTVNGKPETKTRKPREKKKQTPASDLIAVECSKPCGWKGVGSLKDKCPECGSYLLSTDTQVEG